MSSVHSHPTVHDRPRRTIQRRHGACEPCRRSKTKCDGGKPCGACRTEKRRQLPCAYSEKIVKLRQASDENRRRAEPERLSVDSFRTISPRPMPPRPSSRAGHDMPPVAPTMSTNQVTSASILLDSQVRRDVELCGPVSHKIALCNVLEEFIPLKTAKIQATQSLLRSRSFRVLQDPTFPGDSSSPKQILVDDTSAHSARTESVGTSSSRSYTQSLRSQLRAIYDLIDASQLHLAWIQLGSVIREVQVRDLLHPAGSPSTSLPGDNLANLCVEILELDCLLGLVHGYKSCVSPSFRSRSAVHSVAYYRDDPSISLARTDLYQQIQSVLEIDMTREAGIVEFLQQAHNISEPSMPTSVTEIGLCTTDQDSTAAHDLMINAHVLFIVVHCRKASICDFYCQGTVEAPPLTGEATDIIRNMSLHFPRQKNSECHKVVRSANFIIDAFKRLYDRDPVETSSKWIRCYSAFTAVVLVGISGVKHDGDWRGVGSKLKMFEDIFRDLQSRNTNCRLFQKAVEAIHSLRTMKEQKSESSKSKHGESRIHRRRIGSAIKAPLSEIHVVQQPSFPSPHKGQPTQAPRKKRKIDNTNNEDSTRISMEQKVDQPAGQNPTEDTISTQPSKPPPPPFTESQQPEVDQYALFEDRSATYQGLSQPGSLTTSATTSFADGEAGISATAEAQVGHPGPPFVYPFPYEHYHPPMVWGELPYSSDECIQFSTNHIEYGSSPVLGNGMSGTTMGLSDAQARDIHPPMCLPKTYITYPIDTTVTTSNYSGGAPPNGPASDSQGNGFFNPNIGRFHDQEKHNELGQSPRRDAEEPKRPRLGNRRISANESPGKSHSIGQNGMSVDFESRKLQSLEHEQLEDKLRRGSIDGNYGHRNGFGGSHHHHHPDPSRGGALELVHSMTPQVFGNQAEGVGYQPIRGWSKISVNDGPYS